jgi:uncharacterized protein
LKVSALLISSARADFLRELFEGHCRSNRPGAWRVLHTNAIQLDVRYPFLMAARCPLKELVETITKALVDHPDDVQVKSTENAQGTILELRVHHDDLGKVIGRQGRTAKAVRTLLGAAGVKTRKRYTLEILED